MRIRLLTSRPASSRPRRHARHERGAIGVLIAVLIGGGVLLGMGALAVDVGQIYTERAQLQNGADAAALAVATTCMTDTCSPGISHQYANANASDGTSAVNLVCGTGMGNCPASTGRLTDCPRAPSDGTNYVDVHTSTLTPSGSTLLPPVFARTVLGYGNYPGTTVGACAQAEWGASSAAVTTSLTFSGCDWSQATGNGTEYGPAPGSGSSPSPSLDSVLTLGANENTGCASDPASTDGPGTFGWTIRDSPHCTLQIEDTSSYEGSNRQSPGVCQNAIATAQAQHSTLIVPVYSKCTHGGTSSYTLEGFAAFVVTGYSLPGSSAPDWLNPAHTCAKNQVCVSGYFTRDIIPPKSIPASGCHISHTTQNLGATWVKLSG